MPQEPQVEWDENQADGQNASLEDQSPALTIIFQSWTTPVIGVGMLLLGLLVGYFGRPVITPNGDATPVSEVSVDPDITPDLTSSQDEDREAQKTALMNTLLGDTRHFQGDEDAPVTIIEFSDFQCPYCNKWTNGTGEEIKQQYVEDGLVRIGYWHFPILGAQSVWAAEASECAGEQDAFWEYHDYLYQPDIGGGEDSFSKQNLKQFASELGLDMEEFNNCLDSGQFNQYIQGQRSVAQQIGVSSTPTFLVNGEPVVGAQPFQAFQQVIEDELAATSE